ncbi:hypothetical protein ACQJBY_041753 [Aegilops geniculata]
MEVATVFLETSLGTRLAVSFPASATTVADLKRRVGDEHAAAFPHIGHIAVQSIKVKQGGSLYLLTDSMAVRDAFRGVTGAWHLHVQLHALHQQMPQVPHACNCKHSSQPCVPACHQHDSASRSFAAALGCRKRSASGMLLTHQQASLEATHTESESESERAPPPREKHRAPAADFDSDFGLLSVSVHKEPCSSIRIAGNMCNAPANSKEDAPCVEQLNHVGDPCSEMQLEEKETWTPKEADSSSQQEAMQHNVEQKEPLTATLMCGSETKSSNATHLPPPCAAESTKEGDYSEKETRTARVCNSNGISQGTHLPPPCAAEFTKEANSSEKQAMQHKTEDKEPSTANVCKHESSNKETRLPPPCAAESTKQGDSSEKQAMQHKTEEKGSLTANVCNHESSNKETHLPPPWATKSTKEGDSSGKEAMARQVEEKEPLAANVCDGDESSQGTDHPSPCAAESTKEGDSSEEEAIKHKVEEKVCNSESSSNWTDPSPGDESMNEADSSENEVMQHEAEEKEPWIDSVCKGGGSSHWNDPIEWTDAEQRAWEMALKKRRRPRIAVRKMPNSRAAKLYGYS